MRLLVRTWNLFHGRTLPEQRRPQLQRMMRLVAEGEPDLVCLQEVPVWAVPHLAGWAGMVSHASVTRRPLLGPLAGPLQRVDARLVRSALTGQANAMLLGAGLTAEAVREHQVSTRGERRVAQIVRIRAAGGLLVAVNMHLTTRDEPAASAELERVARLVAGEARCLVCGDLNLPGTGIPGFSEPLPGIDQILVRGLQVVQRSEPWPDERRRLDGVLLSDHAPVEAEMMWQ